MRVLAHLLKTRCFAASAKRQVWTDCQFILHQALQRSSCRVPGNAKHVNQLSLPGLPGFHRGLRARSLATAQCAVLLACVLLGSSFASVFLRLLASWQVEVANSHSLGLFRRLAYTFMKLVSEDPAKAEILMLISRRRTARADVAESFWERI